MPSIRFIISLPFLLLGLLFVTIALTICPFEPMKPVGSEAKRNRWTITNIDKTPVAYR